MKHKLTECNFPISIFLGRRQKMLSRRIPSSRSSLLLGKNASPMLHFFQRYPPSPSHSLKRESLSLSLPVKQQLRGIKFVKRVISKEEEKVESSPKNENNENQAEAPNAYDINVYDLSKGEITPTTLRIDIIQASVDKLAKKMDHLQTQVNHLHQVVDIMTTSVQMMAEHHVNQRATSILKSAKIINEKTPFVKVNTEQRLEDLLKLYVKNTGVSGAEDAVKKSLPIQAYVAVDGSFAKYVDNALHLPSWITTPANVSKGSKIKKMVSGEVSVMGTLDAICRALHRAMRIPVLLRRYSSRIHKAIYKSTIEESLKGMENVTIFTIVSNVETDAIPERFVNRILKENDLLKLEEHVLNSFEGDVYIPTDSELVTDFFAADPLKDIAGIWRIFSVCEFNGQPYSKISKSDIQNRIALILLIRILYLLKYELFIGSCLNPLQ